MYSDTVRARFMQPQFAGTLQGEQVLQARVGAPEQGAVMEIYIAIDAQRIQAARFKAYGCGACIATADYVCELLEGTPVDQLEHFDTQPLVTALGLTGIKLHCAWLASEAAEQLLLAWRQAEASVTH
ncbi:MAG TPA: iron-sulfur cluster assembly scaffold protein [Paenalcaligenes hominis]|uniref:Iron-sulfur cluster assembly scaffold protein n=1 Tax=Paenalcaligenes hominis TaxID=643674 RepID=A0A9D2VFJ8_9BURK|nr:iron-sulfur cluster assembly scaffold protein [Paenalcaligenes hominis]NJB64243.1 nitrogen fixation NifU-like protein [Paenalcaligenes hominis]GGE69112.1 hypothetical protein GCM10007278_16550 [Paenalcaligenes hominis]HJH23559.1 iron-sulfur cluster assembly scaffold protein [Paenalcaligenes hominis]